MKNFHLNFRKTVRDRAGEMSAKAYGHYLRFKPYLYRISKLVKPDSNKFSK